MSKRPYIVQDLIDNYGRLGDARKIGPTNGGGVIRCPRGDADGGMEMDDYYAYFLPFCEAKDVTEQEE